MTEEKFEAHIKHFCNAIEKTADGAAKVLDKSLNRAWKFIPIVW